MMVWCRHSNVLYFELHHSEIWKLNSAQMIYGIGIDVVEIQRIEQAITRSGGHAPYC